MVAYTTTYNLKKPTVADDEDVWGGYLNDSMDIIDDVLDGTVPVTGIDINSGTLDNVVIGGSTANTGTFTVLSATTSLGVTGDITVSGTVDGRDVAADGTKLDGIESGATADQTKADIDALGIAASTAATLATARNIALTGDVTGNVNFDGSGNVSITTTIADDSHNHVISNIDGLQTALDGKLGSTAKAADSNLLDNIDSTRFVYGDNTSATVTTTNFDSLTKSGFYNGNSSATGNPFSDWAWAIHHEHTGLNGYGFQLAVDNGNPENLRVRTQSANSWSSWVTYWNSSNDGAGSGLDADTLDGVQGSSYLRSDASDTFTTLSGTQLNIGSQVQLAESSDRPDLLQITSTTSTWGGLQIRNSSNEGRWSFMTDGAVAGIYDDENSDWHIQMSENAGVTLYHNAVSKLNTHGSGVNINGNINAVDNIYLATALYHEGDTDTYLSFGTNTINLRAGNQHEVFVNTAGMFLVNSALHEDYDALSGTSVTIDPNTGAAWSLTMTGNTTFTFGATTNNYSVGLIVQLTGNGGTVTWPSSVDWAGGTAPDAPASGETDIYVFWTRDGGTTWYGVQSIDAAA